jgi:integrase
MPSTRSRKTLFRQPTTRRQPPPRPIRAYTRDELDAIAAEPPPALASVPAFAAATGLRPEEWQALEHPDIDRRERTLSVLRSLSSGEVVELGKTHGARRQVPLSLRALSALDAIPPRLDTPRLFPGRRAGPLNLHNFRRAGIAGRLDALDAQRERRDAEQTKGV